MAARMEDVTGERDPWQDSPDPWAGLLNRYNLEDSQHSSIDSIGAHECQCKFDSYVPTDPQSISENPTEHCARHLLCAEQGVEFRNYFAISVSFLPSQTSRSQ